MKLDREPSSSVRNRSRNRPRRRLPRPSASSVTSIGTEGAIARMSSDRSSAISAVFTGMFVVASIVTKVPSTALIAGSVSVSSAWPV